MSDKLIAPAFFHALTAEELDREFDKFWNGKYSEAWPGKRVYSHVDKGTAKSLFLEGWVRYEVYLYAKKEAQKYIEEYKKKENHD